MSYIFFTIKSMRKQHLHESNSFSIKIYLSMAYYRADMLSIKARSTLAQLLAEVILLSETVESYRQSLAQLPYFDSIGLFRWLDRQEKGYLSERDWQAIMGTKHRKLLTYAFSWFDTMKVGEVSRLQFASFLLPKDNLQLRQLVAGRVQRPEMVPAQQEHMLAQVDVFRALNMELMKREMKIIQLRRALIEDRDYSIEAVIKAMDGHEHGWLCVEDFRVFMQNYGFDATPRQVEKLTEVINCSLDGKVTIAQLKWTVQGLEGNDKTYLRKIKASNKKEPPKKSIDFEASFTEHKQKHKQTAQLPPTPSQIEYQGIMDKLKLAEEEQVKADAELVNYQEESKASARRHYYDQVQKIQARRAAEEVARAREREEMLARQAMDQELETIITKTHQLQAESERLARLQNRLQIQQDTLQLRHEASLLPSIPLAYAPRVSEQFSFQADPLPSYPLAHAHPLVDDTYRSQSFQSRINDSDTYLTAAKQLREKIKREREIERSIRSQFSSGQYESVVKEATKTPGSILNKTNESKRPQDISRHYSTEYATARQFATAGKDTDGVDTTLKLPVSSAKKT